MCDSIQFLNEQTVETRWQEFYRALLGMTLAVAALPLIYLWAIASQIKRWYGFEIERHRPNW